jgi:hypothetical protein
MTHAMVGFKSTIVTRVPFTFRVDRLTRFRGAAKLAAVHASYDVTRHGVIPVSLAVTY